MSNEHIGRLQAIGLGKESTSGTAVAASFWIPKAGGSFTPEHETAKDDSAYGVIDGLKDQQTVKNMTKVNLNAMVRDIFFGHLLTAAYGTAYSTVKFPISSISGTFSEGETITETTSSATGTLRRNDQGDDSPALYIEPVSGTFTGGQTLTGGTSSATATGGTIEAPGTVRTHIFRRNNTNAHPTYTLYGHDPVGDERCTYGMLDSLEIEAAVGGYCSFNASFMGKKLASTSAQTPSYTEQNAFLPKFATFKAAANHDALGAASAVGIERFKLVINKNAEAYQSFGDTDVSSIHNKRFDISGDLDLIYNATTWRDYVSNSTKRAMRLSFANTDVTIGSSANPTFQLDLPSVSFEEWSRNEDNDELVKQTISFTAEWNAGRSLTGEALLQNTQTTAY